MALHFVGECLCYPSATVFAGGSAARNFEGVPVGRGHYQLLASASIRLPIFDAIDARIYLAVPKKDYK